MQVTAPGGYYPPPSQSPYANNDNAASDPGDPGAAAEGRASPAETAEAEPPQTDTSGQNRQASANDSGPETASADGASQAEGGAATPAQGPGQATAAQAGGGAPDASLTEQVYEASMVLGVETSALAEAMRARNFPPEVVSAVDSAAGRLQYVSQAINTSANPPSSPGASPSASQPGSPQQPRGGQAPDMGAAPPPQSPQAAPMPAANGQQGPAGRAGGGGGGGGGRSQAAMPQGGAGNGAAARSASAPAPRATPSGPRNAGRSSAEQSAMASQIEQAKRELVTQLAAATPAQLFEFAKNIAADVAKLVSLLKEAHFDSNLVQALESAGATLQKVSQQAAAIQAQGSDANAGAKAAVPAQSPGSAQGRRNRVAQV